MGFWSHHYKTPRERKQPQDFDAISGRFPPCHPREGSQIDGTCYAVQNVLYLVLARKRGGKGKDNSKGKHAQPVPRDSRMYSVLADLAVVRLYAVGFGYVRGLTVWSHVTMHQTFFLAQFTDDQRSSTSR